MPYMPNSYKKETFADRLESLRGVGRTRATNDEIAAIAAGKTRKAVTKQAVSRWALGTAVPDSDAIANLARHWDVTKEWLFFGDSPRQPISIDVAKAIDLLPEHEHQEVARDVARRLDNVGEVPIGPSHDRFMTYLKAISTALKKYSKPSH